MCGARRSSLQHLLSTPVKPVIASGQTGSAGENDEEPTNVSPGRPVGAGARRVVLGSAGHLEHPQSTLT